LCDAGGFKTSRGKPDFARLRREVPEASRTIEQYVVERRVAPTDKERAEVRDKTLAPLCADVARRSLKAMGLASGPMTLVEQRSRLEAIRRRLADRPA
jgi:hypothetical protein